LNNKSTDLTISMIFAICIYMSSIGILAGTYIIAMLLGIHIVMIISISSIITGSVMIKNPEPKVTARIQIGTRILVQAFIATAAYHLYILGYTILPHMILVTLPIPFASNIIYVICQPTQKSE
jgi:hypothetical protein